MGFKSSRDQKAKERTIPERRALGACCTTPNLSYDPHMGGGAREKQGLYTLKNMRQHDTRHQPEVSSCTTASV